MHRSAARLFSILLTFHLVLGFSSKASALAGSFDPGFGVGGLVSTDLSSILGLNGNERARATALYPGTSAFAGKILVSGNIDLDNGYVGVARYNSDGSLDTTFGDGGVAATVLEELSENFALELQADDKILIAGAQEGMFGDDSYIIRYCADGSPDDGANCGSPGFGVDGAVIFDASGDDTDEEITDLAIQPDGKILGCGSASFPAGNDFMVVRLCPDGSFDDGVNCGSGGFGNGGIATSDPSGETDFGQAMVLQPDGKIVVGGLADGFGEGDIGLSRFCPDGSLDAGANCDVSGGFGFGGSTTMDMGTESDWIFDLALQSDGKILGVGSTGEIGDSSSMIVRFCPNGDLNIGTNCGTQFGGDGFIIFDRSMNNQPDYLNSIALQADGKVLVAGGFITVDSEVFYYVNRYSADGDVDLSFGFDGTVQFEALQTQGADDLAVQEDGKILVVGPGRLPSGGGDNFILARFLGDSGDLAAQVSVTPSSVQPNESIVYTLVASNLGTAKVFNAQLRFTLPPGTALVSAPGCTGTTDFVCALGDLEGGAGSAPIAVTLTSANEGVVALTAVVSGAVTDTNASNDQATGFALVSTDPVDGGDGGNGGDGDGDGDSEDCDDGSDNDGNGQIDCSDPACTFSPVCDGSVGGGGCSLNPAESASASGAFLLIFLAGAAMSYRTRLD